jgi:hypothetical protein
MTIKRTLIAGAVALSAALTFAGAASAETTWQHRHPRQEQVLERARHERHLIRHERREGLVGRYEARRLLHRVNHVAREDHRLAFRHGGRITRGEQHRMDRQETQVRQHIPS